MVESKIIQRVREILNSNEELREKYITDRGGVKRNLVSQDIKKYDEKLLTSLLKDDLIKKSYTSIIDGTTIFKADEFSEMFLYKEYWEDSYTKFSNKIGLTSSGKFIDESTDVVLDFPYKDTVLKAGMSKEDVEKPNEPFLNETLAKPEIDELFEPKILVNAKKYDKDGDHKVTKFSEKDNLIIKGNNLIALHSLEEKYAGKIKLIYLDPPYNTGNDGFNYNDNFNHSTWLTFMKNRLLISKKLLNDHGIIAIQCDDNEQAYLKVLMDEIFGRKNFVNTIAVKMTPSSGQKRKFANIKFIKNKEYILLYRKGQIELTKLIDPTYEYDNHYSIYFDGKECTTLREKIKRTLNRDLKTNNYLKDDDVHDFIVKNSSRIYRTHQPSKWAKNNFSQSNNVEYVSGIKKVFNDDNTKFEYLRRNSNSKIERLEPLKWRLTEDGANVGTLRGDFWDVNYEGDMGNISKEGGNTGFGQGQKPERLLKDILLSCTSKGDIVLDFFMGSATTQAVAMKMGRRFIGIEQMDYINSISVPRLQKVIDGEQGGISKAVNWQGGGSFVYAELMEKNQGYLDDISNASNLNELNRVYDRMKENVDFDFRVDLDLFEKKKSTFSFERQQEELRKIIDKNQLYYNEANIDDKNIHDILSDEDYQFNKSFYGKGDDLNA